MPVGGTGFPLEGHNNNDRLASNITPWQSTTHRQRERMNLDRHVLLLWFLSTHRQTLVSPVKCCTAFSVMVRPSLTVMDVQRLCRSSSDYYTFYIFHRNLLIYKVYALMWQKCHFTTVTGGQYSYCISVLSSYLWTEPTVAQWWSG